MSAENLYCTSVASGSVIAAITFLSDLGHVEYYHCKIFQKTTNATWWMVGGLNWNN
jgi:hypothetical protein